MFLILLISLEELVSWKFKASFCYTYWGILDTYQSSFWTCVGNSQLLHDYPGLYKGICWHRSYQNQINSTYYGRYN